MKYQYRKMYLFISIGQKVFRDTLNVATNKYGEFIVRAKEKSPYYFLQLKTPSVHHLDCICTSPKQISSYYPMFSFDESFENYTAKLNQLKQEQIDELQAEINKLATEISTPYQYSNALNDLK